MKVLIAHNHYQQRGGEDSVVSAEIENLRNNGIEVVYFSKSNSEIRNFRSKMYMLFNMHYSKKSKKELERVLKIEKPDVVHIHNFFAVMTPSVYEACKEYNVPVVQTLHNYRILCSAATLYRNGRTCEQCVKGFIYQSIIHRCYKQSFTATAVLSHLIAYHRKRDTWNNSISKIITLTEFAKEKIIEGGILRHNVMVKPNFVKDPFGGNYDSQFEKRKGILFVGRVSEEKGLDVLLKAVFKTEHKLTVVGGGPLLQEFRKKYESDNISFLGERSQEVVSKKMLLSRVLVVPSKWYEGFPMVILEAYARGLPVICSRLGGLQEVVSDGKTGLHFQVGNEDELLTAIESLLSNDAFNKEICSNARFLYESKYTPIHNFINQSSIYKSLIEEVK